MSNKTTCALCKETNGRQSFLYVDEYGVDNSFSLFNSLWDVKDGTFVLMTQNEFDKKWMLLGAGNILPFCDIHPIQFINWSDTLESEQDSLWQHVFPTRLNNTLLSFSCKPSVSILHGATDIVIFDELSGSVISGFQQSDGRLVGHICKLSVTSDALFRQHIETNSSIVNETLSYESYSFKVLLPSDFANVHFTTQFLGSLGSISLWDFTMAVMCCKAEANVFGKEEALDSPSAKPYLLARAFYLFWQKTPMRRETLPISTFLADVKNQFGISLSKADLQQFKTFQLRGSSISLVPSVKEFGDNNKWNEAVSPEVFRVLWTMKAEQDKPMDEIIHAAEQAKRLAEQAQKEAAQAKAAADKEKREAEQAKHAAEQAQEEATQAKAAADKEKREAEQAKHAAEQAQEEATQAKAVADKEKREAEQAKHAAEQTVQTKAATDKDQQRNLEKIREEKQNPETNAIINFWETLNDASWRYSLRDIVRFHTSIRCEPLTILGGAPGSGKSSLARLYAEYFGLGEENQFLQIDVQPSWHDRMDFLGFIKTHGDATVFEDAETGMASFLRGTTGKTELSLACLEEINLARPEHYFADFLQRISLDDDKRAGSPISFWTKGGEKLESFELSKYVRFVGTCNFDETTQNFSARFLDRCNYIEFSPRTLKELLSSTEPKDITEHSAWNWTPYSTENSSESVLGQCKEAVLGLLQKLTEFKEPADTARSDDRPRNLLKDLGLIPSARAIQGILRYVCARVSTAGDIPDGKMKDMAGQEKRRQQTDLLDRAVDEALVQRLFPKMLSSQVSFPGTDRQYSQENLLNILSKKYPLSFDFVAKHTEAF